MATTSADAPAPDAAAAALDGAAFVRLFGAADGDSLAASALLAAALRDAGVPFHVRIAAGPTTEPPAADGVSLALGREAPSADASLPRSAAEPASSRAFSVAREAGLDPDPVLALAGVVAAGRDPAAGCPPAMEAAREDGRLERRSGIAVPTADLAVGLAASTLFVAPYSGDIPAARERLAAVSPRSPPTEADRRRLASLVAVDVAGHEDASRHAATAVERALRPYAIRGPAATLAGYADALDALALREPALGVAFALGGNDAALDAWRDHGLAAQRAVSDARLGRYDGSIVARVDARPDVLPTVARLLRDFRSPEPTAFVSTTGPDGDVHAAAASRDPVGVDDAMATAAAEFGGTADGTASRARGRFEGDHAPVAAAVRGAL